MLVQAEEIIVRLDHAEETVIVATGQHLGTSNYRTLDELQARLDPNGAVPAPRAQAAGIWSSISKIQEIVPWFKPELHSEDEGQEVDGNPRSSRTQTRWLRRC